MWAEKVENGVIIRCGLLCVFVVIFHQINFFAEHSCVFTFFCPHFSASHPDS